MADEPSWEDIFRPKPESGDDASAPEVEQAATEQYPPTMAFPAADPGSAPTRALPVDATPAPAGDPLAGLIGGAPAAQGDPGDPFAGLGGGAQTPDSGPERRGDDPFAGLAGGAQAADSGPERGRDDPFAALFGEPAPVSEQLASAPAVATTRRELRESEAAAARTGGGGRGGGRDTPRPARKRNLLWLKITLPIVLVLGGAAGVAAFGWFNYNEQVRELLGIPLPTDYEGEGNGEEVVVSIVSGDIGADVANTLHAAGVTMTFDAVYDYLVENPDVGFTPGNWRLQKEMSAESAVAALQDPANKVTAQLLITEGTVLPDALELISSTTGIPLEEVQAAAADPTQYGVPANAPSLEGYLFPATYELDGTETAQVILQMLVTTMFERLDAAGVPADQRHQVLTMAALIQREAGSNPDDFYRVSRVFTNRLEQGINLESDATVAYGTGRLHTVWTEPEERADASNPYNTYANPGLPVGPIGLPGELAIDAALHPADGPWLFFVPVNLATGETVFSETAEEHQAAVDRLLEWCEASAENASYCE